MVLVRGLLYILASILFVLGLKMLSSPATARRGNLVSALGMLIAVATTLSALTVIPWVWLLGGAGLGAAIGALAARLVKMTAMPEMVGLFNGFGGLASMLVGWAEYHGSWAAAGEIPTFTRVAIFLTILIGGVAFSGSLVAYGKLSATITGRPILYQGQNIVNAVLLTAIVLLGVWFSIQRARPPEATGFDLAYALLLGGIAAALILGVLSTIPIGGADMPVVISLLNSYSGLAVCAAGFVIGSTVLIVSGALVGASGIILTQIMCKAMNRSLTNVLFSGFGATATTKAGGYQGEASPITPEDTYFLLEAARNVVIVPGYGMAAAQAQHGVR
ncbi:MAG: NAD(P)(+) transhydrogenase (Re/Si-specific) subunit beta, partial [Planctomycetes bacterium]|nr:NAD(P)(+) transhydrogenase (Re/Si-specific) subunit beta [Planctomycetota bacterium]